MAAGGTGGHLTPALAVADELTARGALVTFVTTPSQLERVAERFPAYALEMRGFERRLLARENAVTLWRLAAAAPRSWGIVSAARPQVAVGGGGYLSGPVVAAAALRRVPALAIESDAHLGVTNRLLSSARVARLPELPHRGPRAAPLRAHRAAAVGGAARRRRRHGPRRLRPAPRRCRWCSSSAAARARRA